MTEVVWSGEALDDLDDIYLIVASEKPIAALNLARRLYSAGDSLELFPNRGRKASNGARELTNVGPYILRYDYDEVVDRATILTIRHGARDAG